MGPYAIGLVKNATKSFAGGLIVMAASLAIGGIVVLAMRHDKALERTSASGGRE